MKYVVTWRQRQNTTAESQAHSLQVFSRWTPAEGTTFLQFVSRVDGRGGFAVVETDDPELIARDTAIFGSFFDMSVYPVLEARQAAEIAASAMAFVHADG
jgi:hypothetical protein